MGRDEHLPSGDDEGDGDDGESCGAEPHHGEPQRGDTAGEGREQSGGHGDAGSHEGEQEQRTETIARVGLHGDLEDAHAHRDEGDGDGEHPHGSNRYPTPHTVSSRLGLWGSSSIFLRSRRT